MKEEEVDQYFKNKFSQFSPAPSADAWARLQNKLEPMPQKRPARWLYYAAAAVTLVLLSGALLVWLQTRQPDSDANLARLKPIQTPLNSKSVGQPTVADVSPDKLDLIQTTEPITEQSATESAEKKETSTTTSSKPVKKKTRIRPGILIAKYTQPVKQSGNTTRLPAAPVKTESYSAESAASQTLASNQPAKENVIEVVYKKDPVPTVAYASENEYETAEEAIKENLSKKSRLVKNIFKQARNLKNGDKVELSTLGFSANYRIDVESKLLKQKYTKVINL